jgi:hypothetical protein
MMRVRVRAIQASPGHSWQVFAAGLGFRSPRMRFPG